MSGSHDIEISADPSYQQSELEALAAAFGGGFRVQITSYGRLDAGEFAPILILVFGSITKGFFEAMGRDLWGAVTKRLVGISKKQEGSEVVFKYTSGTKQVELHVKSSHDEVIASAFDQISKTLEIVEESGDAFFYFGFDESSDQWRLSE
jgi:hypothetical protein